MKALDITSLSKLGSLVYPIMLAQEAGELSEMKTAELLGLDLVSYREAKWQAIGAVLSLIEELPSPMVLLLKSAKEAL